MVRFVLGIIAGGLFSGLCLVSLHIMGQAMSPQPVVVAQLDLPASGQPTVAEVEAARAGFEANLPTRQKVFPNAPVPEVSDQEAVASAKFAAALRARTGAVPDPAAPSGGLITKASGSSMASVSSAYFETWDALIKACYAVVADHNTLDTSTLTVHGEERVNYAQPGTEQTWFSADKAFKVEIDINHSSSPSGISRMCRVESNRFARVNVDAVKELKPRFHKWWSANRFAEKVTPAGAFGRDEANEVSRHGEIYHVKTSFGSQQGCEMYVQVTQHNFGRDTDTTFAIWESGDDGCTARPATGAGGVRINRLPQAGD